MRPTLMITRAARPRRKPFKTVLLALILLVVFLLLVSVGVSTYVGWQLTHPARKALADSPDRYGLAYTPIQFPSRTQDVTLEGWYIPVSCGANTGQADNHYGPWVSGKSAAERCRGDQIDQGVICRWL